MPDNDSTGTGNTPVIRDRREAVREKASQVRVRQSRARVIRRSGLGFLAVGALAAVAVVVAWTVSTTTGRPQLSPDNATDDGFAVADVVTGSLGVGVDTREGVVDEAAVPSETPAAAEASAAGVEAPAVDIRVYVDYLSTGAREWQMANSAQLSSWVDKGSVSLSYYPVAMLTAKSNGTKYSLRAAGAAACVATHSPDALFAFNDDLLTRQPAVDTDGYTDVELADMALASGVDSTKAVRECIESGDYVSWAKEATDRAVAGIPDTDDVALTRTPMVLVNGKPYVGELANAVEFSQFVLRSDSDAFYDATPEPTPTATPTP